MKNSFVEKEEKILSFWKKKKIFQKSIQQRKGKRFFVFFEGPPTANGRPGIHHVLARVFKDIIPRYKTMQGFRVIRKAGWDTHGLPVELEIEKKKGFKNKKDIERFGVEKFNQLCRQSVWEYKEEWERLTERIGFWIDMKNAYITYEPDYIETLFWIIKQAWNQGLLEKDYKVVPYCPRCGTVLSSHEVAQGYKKIKEPAIYVKFPLEKEKNTFLLAWTTTPWTLPGNLALAIDPLAIYIQAKRGNEIFIIAEKRKEVLKNNYRILKKLRGKDLVGKKYLPLFPFLKEQKPQDIENAFVVLPGEFISLEEGTGIVHIAPMYGEDDFQLGKKHQLPLCHTVDEFGRFKEEVKNWKGLFVKEADNLIIKQLEERELLFKKEEYEHEYPFCWRCKTPLLYYAKRSWFIRMKRLKKDLLANNQKINWIPSHIKKGRFGGWLKEIKDWALSRERYWGTPLPVWECSHCGNTTVIGSKKELRKQKFSKNTYYILRHGDTVYQNRKRNISYPKEENYQIPLSKEGEKQIKRVAKELKNKNIDLIFCSPFLRTRQTAEIVSQEIKKEIIVDKRLVDIDLGVFHGKEKKQFYNQFPRLYDRFYHSPPNGESGLDILKRMLSFMKEVEKKYERKTILIVSHGDPLWWLKLAMEMKINRKLLGRRDKPGYIKTGQWEKLSYRILPYNEKMEIDFHRPYIDKVEFYCSRCGKKMKRVSDVIDCWFDSGAMPFAQYHYPFENKKLIDNGIQFPADYICEGIDQTRGWFYTLLAVSTLLKRGPAYKNVICLGHVLDEKGEKMSKSRGNIVDPWIIVNKYGIDATRWYFYTINPPGEPKRFSEKEIFEVIKKFLNIYWNSFCFFATYTNSKIDISKPAFNNPLDRWIVSRLYSLVSQVEKNLDNYQIRSAAQLIEEFVVKDFSQWYIRRSRKRFQRPSSLKENREALQTLGWTLLFLSKITASFIPFLSEYLYQELKKITSFKAKQSVHLEDWPRISKKWQNKTLEKKMAQLRVFASLGLRVRAKAGIKIRQPLKSAGINFNFSRLLLEILKEELNVKTIEIKQRVVKRKGWKKEKEKDFVLALNIKIDPQLKKEGIKREVVRHLQKMRNKLNLNPSHWIKIYYQGNSYLEEIINEFKKDILSQTLAKTIEKGKDQGVDLGLFLKIENFSLWIGIKQI